MEYRRIKYFLKAAEAKNFTEAAADLFISHQALIKQISLLETEIGGKLFDRTTRSVSLTELGNEAYQRFLAIDQKLDAALGDLKKMSTTETFRLRFGIFSALPGNQILHVINTFKAAHPEITLELIMNEYLETHLALLENKIDICLTNTHNQENWDGFAKLPLLNLRAQIAVSTDHPWAAKSQLTLEDMQQGEYIKLDISDSIELYNEKQRRDKKKLLIHRVPPEESFYNNVPCCRRTIAPNFQTLLAVLAQGRGFAIITRNFFHDPDKIKFFDIPYQDFEFQTAFIYPENTPNKAILALIQVAQNIDLSQID